MILNLCNQAKSDVKYETSTFPDGQLHFKLTGPDTQFEDVSKVVIVTSLQAPEDFFRLALARNVLCNFVNHVHIFVTYLMGGRMDRAIDDRQPDTLDMTGALLSSCLYEGDKVTFVDPHSPLTQRRALELLNDNPERETCAVDSVLPCSLVEAAGVFEEGTVVVVPDEGAVGRVADLLNSRLAGQRCPPTVFCTKVRDSQTGKLSGFDFADEYQEDVAQAAKRLLIIDDICDGGGTFSGIAKLLRETNEFAPIELCVTHGIFSKGLPIHGIGRVFTTDTFRQPDFERRFSLERAEAYGYLVVQRDFVAGLVDELDAEF